MNKQKKDLVVVESPLNDKGSKLYLNAIKREWRENYKDEVNLIIYTIENQDVLEEAMFLNPNAKVLVLTPSNLSIPTHLQHRNAEQNQTARYVVDVIREEGKWLNAQSISEILLIGKGRINQYIFNELCLKDGYCVAMYGSKFKPEKVSPKYGNNFDIIVNAVSHGSETRLNTDYCTVFDISGNFVKKEYDQNNITTMKEIGKATVKMLFNDVVNCRQST